MSILFIQNNNMWKYLISQKIAKQPFFLFSMFIQKSNRKSQLWTAEFHSAYVTTDTTSEARKYMAGGDTRYTWAAFLKLMELKAEMIGNFSFCHCANSFLHGQFGIMIPTKFRSKRFVWLFFLHWIIWVFHLLIVAARVTTMLWCTFTVRAMREHSDQKRRTKKKAALVYSHLCSLLLHHHWGSSQTIKNFLKSVCCVFIKSKESLLLLDSH